MKKSKKGPNVTDEMRNNLDEKKEKLEATYTELVDRMRAEKEKLDYELRHEYRNARRFVRANPEQGIGIAFASGLFIGIVIAKLTQR